MHLSPDSTKGFKSMGIDASQRDWSWSLQEGVRVL